MTEYTTVLLLYQPPIDIQNNHLIIVKFLVPNEPRIGNAPLICLLACITRS
jgi:hypothetical protein